MERIQKFFIVAFALLVFTSGAKLVLFSHYCCGIWVEFSMNSADDCSSETENSCCKTSSHHLPLVIDKACCKTEAVVFDLGKFSTNNFKFEVLSLSKIFPKNFLHFLSVLFFELGKDKLTLNRTTKRNSSPPLHLQQPRYISFQQLVLYA